MENSFSASSLCPDLWSAVASVWWTSGFPGVRRSALRSGGTGLFIFFQTHETKPLAEIGLRKIGIELDRLRELRNRLFAFLIADAQVLPRCSVRQHYSDRSQFP